MVDCKQDIAASLSRWGLVGLTLVLAFALAGCADVLSGDADDDSSNGNDADTVASEQSGQDAQAAQGNDEAEGDGLPSYVVGQGDLPQGFVFAPADTLGHMQVEENPGYRDLEQYQGDAGVPEEAYVAVLVHESENAGIIVEADLHSDSTNMATARDQAEQKCSGNDDEGHYDAVVGVVFTDGDVLVWLAGYDDIGGDHISDLGALLQDRVSGTHLCSYDFR